MAPTFEQRCLGAVFGAAIGDAMGHPTEFMSLEEIRAKFGPNGVQGFELYWTKEGQRFAPYTDDTQMAECVLRSLLETRNASLDETMQTMAKSFIEWRLNPQGGHRAPGNACLAGCGQLANGTHWSVAGHETAGGCGSVMRAYPFGLVFHDDEVKAEAWAVEHSKLTHRDPIALAACAAMAVGMVQLVRDEPVDEVVNAMIRTAEKYSVPTANLMTLAQKAASEGVGPDAVFDRLRAWAAHEAIAAGVYVLARNRDDLRAAILEGANTPGDSDSIATLAGALVGARLGVDALPAEWIADIERTAELRALATSIAQ